MYWSTYRNDYSEKTRKLSDFLAYQFPNQSAHYFLGQFEACNNVSELSDSFVIADFLNENHYVFNGTEVLEDHDFNWHFSTDLPPDIQRDTYIKHASGMLQAIRSLGMKKVVFSRVKHVEFNTDKALPLFNQLCQEYPKAFVYLVSSPLFGTWIGATPEILLEVHGNHVFTMSLAATKSTDSSDEWNQKELDEQQYVTDFIVDSLKENEINSIEIVGPYSHEAGPVKHLRTDITFDLESLSPTVIANALHPTPAVSGLPRPLAMEMIEAIEKHDLNYNRSLYTGYIGKISDQETKLYVNLRCCQLFKDNACLYVGGGFTKDSNVEDEWEETERKSKTLLSVIQNVR